MSMMVSFVLSFFPRDVLDEILNLIESVSEDFPSYSCSSLCFNMYNICAFVFVRLRKFLRLTARWKMLPGLSFQIIL